MDCYTDNSNDRPYSSPKKKIKLNEKDKVSHDYLYWIKKLGKNTS